MRISALGALSALGVLLALMFSAPALAKTITIAPPGNSGVSQYDEVIPTVRGNQPTSTVHVTPGSTGGSGGGGGGTGSSISSATQRAFDRHGSAGRAAAALARATAPAKVQRRPSTGATSSASTGDGFSPVKSLFQAVTGSSASGGLGALLPIILVVSAIGVMALAIARRRRAT